MRVIKKPANAAVLLAFLPLFLLLACSTNNSRAFYEFTTVRRGNIERSVSASGTIHPVSTARVLPQMSGKVERIFVDFNDTVQRGDILAELNTDLLRLRRDQQRAAVLKARANYELQLLSYNSQVALAARDFISEFELLTGKTTLDNMAADLAVAEANLRVIETEINQHAFITSPIDGVVLDRRINEGDTVTDSSTSGSASIFTLAESLSEMQIEANIGELDVAFIYIGQPVRFTLESMSGRHFTGEVENIRLVPIVVNNVVSYTVIIKVENHDGSLLPGMTCAVEFIVQRSENTMLVANAALRFQPSNQAESSSQGQRTGIVALLTGGGRNIRPRAIQGQARATGEQEGLRNLWYAGENGSLEVMQVRIGISSGSATEIFADEDLEGREFILRERI